ncbi:restriction endonuclease subunit S [Staphylococcus sp. IPLA37011]|uniref:restriction endonuclease subunit S n=1 Tax=Staphylococcus TaxID=1279 RepID=UPI0025548D29|nr:restriction endonuclease subunit S [Staphylococcus equorum]MDK9872513.1 restriction endonuclease subunit S [Staphylococcus equorum]
MTNEVKNVPELRFPGFEDEWKLAHLNDLGDFTSGGTPLKTKKSYWNGDIPWLTTGDINGKEIYKASNYIAQEGLENSSAKLIYKKAILIAMYGQGKTRGMSSILNFEAATNQACAIFQTNNDIKFMHQFFRKDYNKLRSLSNDGSQKNLSLTLLKSYQISVPKLEEQKKIGDFFSKLDRQIELEEQKLEKLEEQKKGYMQKIFSQELRFKDENGNDHPEWGENTLGEITNITTGSLDANAMVANGKYKFFTCARETYQIDNYAFDTEALLISGNGANVGYIHHYKGKFNAYQRTYVLDRIETNIYFLKYYLEKNLIKRIYSEKRDGNTPYITRSTLYDMEINIPISNQEQQKIGDFFKKVDELIETQFSKVELLKERKKGFLQKMFV